MSETFGRLFGYFVLTLVVGVVLWVTMGFIGWQWDVTEWPDFVRAVLAVGTLVTVGARAGYVETQRR